MEIRAASSYGKLLEAVRRIHVAVVCRLKCFG
jgi:hypothetical protein